MNNCCIGSQGDICTWIGDVTFTHMLIFLLDRIFIQYNTKIILAISTDGSIKNQIG
jgi:hypothetical protein